MTLTQSQITEILKVFANKNVKHLHISFTVSKINKL